jgi:fumarate reductase flavoprotein subunit
MTAFAAPDQQSEGLLAQKHLKAGITCEQCHTEGIPTKSTSKGNLPKIATAKRCLQCHGSYKQIAESTKNYDTPLYNPHSSHYGDINCYQCHRVHQTSVLFCTSCHQELKIPAAGWKKAKNPADD